MSKSLTHFSFASNTHKEGKQLSCLGCSPEIQFFWGEGGSLFKLELVLLIVCVLCVRASSGGGWYSWVSIKKGWKDDVVAWDVRARNSEGLTRATINLSC